MASSTLMIEQILDLLEKNPLYVAEHISGLALVQLHSPPSPGEWSINEVLAHMRSCSDLWGSAIETIVTQNRPTIRAINPRTWIEHTDYLEQKFGTSFRAFKRQRVELLKTLKALPEKGWSRSATITGAGKPLERTVFFYSHWLATHERTHVKQIGHIAKVMRI